MGQHPHWAHHVVLAPEAASPAKAREFVCLHLLDHSLGYLVDDVRLVVSELATNAVVHAHTTFKVTIRAARDSVLLTVEDDNPYRPVTARSDRMDIGGWGLTIVDDLSAAWGSSVDLEGAKSVWASFPSREPAVSR